MRRIPRSVAYIAALFRSDVRAFLDVMPLYEAPAILDTSKIERLLGGVATTPYEEGIPATLRWLTR